MGEKTGEQPPVTTRKAYDPMPYPDLPQEAKDIDLSGVEPLPDIGERPSAWPEFNRGQPCEPVDPGETVYSD